MSFNILISMVFLIGCTSSPDSNNENNRINLDDVNINISSTLDTIIKPIIKTDETWKNELSELQYYVLRKEGTERAFSGEYWDNKAIGTYTCSACGLTLFESSTKFKSGTGWPSFYQPTKKEHIFENEDKQFGMTRIEVECAQCKGHLGHVFNDGPKPTGLRYCINSVSLDFIPSN